MTFLHTKVQFKIVEHQSNEELIINQANHLITFKDSIYVVMFT